MIQEQVSLKHGYTYYLSLLTYAAAYLQIGIRDIFSSTNLS